MNKVFMEYLDKFVVAFIDDIVIFSKSKEEHEGHLRLILENLRMNLLCEFWVWILVGQSHFSWTHHICCVSLSISK
jgi:hypothetical protein